MKIRDALTVVAALVIRGFVSLLRRVDRFLMIALSLIILLASVKYIEKVEEVELATILLVWIVAIQTYQLIRGR